MPVIVSGGGGHGAPGKEDVTPIAPASKRPGEPRAEMPRAERDARMGAMVAAHFDMVWRAVKRLGVPAGGVDDAAQEVFIVAARKLADIEIGRERAYLLGVAVRVASDARRAARRRGEIPIDAAPELGTAAAPAGGVSAEAALDQQRLRDALGALLVRMPEEMRETFVLFEIEELNAAEVAAALGIPVGTVASRVRRARDFIRERLPREKETP
jgi:RNA polymerase sigma-70 factor, ECF subfamily